jgi:hypothetical protein
MFPCLSSGTTIEVSFIRWPWESGGNSAGKALSIVMNLSKTFKYALSILFLVTEHKKKKFQSVDSRPSESPSYLKSLPILYGNKEKSIQQIISLPYMSYYFSNRCKCCYNGGKFDLRQEMTVIAHFISRYCPNC